jgi:hypothetical protein
MSDCNGPAGETGEVVLSAACPGGMARQFRVQVRDEVTASHWRLVGCFREAWAAEAAVERLAESGAAVRVIDCRMLPTAA